MLVSGINCQQGSRCGLVPCFRV